MPELVSHASAERIDGLAHELRRLKRLVGGLQEELKTSLSGLISERAQLRKQTEYLDEAANDATNLQQKLEDRVAALETRTLALESRREISSKSFESLSARLTEIGIEVAAAPPPAKLQHALEQMEGMAFAADKVENVTAATELLNSRVDELESCLGQCRSDLEASVDRCQSDLTSKMEQSRSELEWRVQQSRSDLAQTVEECRSDMHSIVELKCQRLQEDQQSTRSSVRAAMEPSCAQGQDIHALKAALTARQAAHSRPRPASAHQELRSYPEHHGAVRQADPPFQQQCPPQPDMAAQQACRAAPDAAPPRHHHHRHRREHPPQQGGPGAQAAVAAAAGGEDPRLWTENQLGLWLVGRGLPVSVARAFEAHLVNGIVAVDLSEDDLGSMGIIDQFHQRRIIKELRALLDGASAPGPEARAPIHEPVQHMHSSHGVYEVPGGAGAAPPGVAAGAVPRPPPASRPQSASTPQRPQSMPPRPQSAQVRPTPYMTTGTAPAGRQNQPPAGGAAAHRSGGWS